MESVSKDIISLLQYLLPGFITAWIFYAFTSYSKPSQFERVIQALLFTVIVQATIYLVKGFFIFAGRYHAFGVWNEAVRLIWSIICAVLFGLLFSYLSNNDKFHALFRRLKITRETSYASEWFGAFSKNVTYIVLHFDDERRLYGWPMEWPSERGKGHFLISQASWLDSDGKEIPITGVETLLVDAKRVKWVEFMKKTWEVPHGEKGIESTCSTADREARSK